MASSALEHEFKAIPARTAEEGAKRALADVGLEGDAAVLGIAICAPSWTAYGPCAGERTPLSA